MKKDKKYYAAIKRQAENGNPHAMLQLSKLYRCGVFQDQGDEEYIYWLKQFFESPFVKALLITIDADDDCDFNDDFYESQSIINLLGFEGEMILQGDIIEAGVALGLYFKNSTDKEELFYAQKGLNGALIASRHDFIEVPEADGITDVQSILCAVTDRIAEFGFWEVYHE